MSYLTDAVHKIESRPGSAFMHVQETEHVELPTDLDARKYAERFYRREYGYDGSFHSVASEVEDGYQVMVMRGEGLVEDAFRPLSPIVDELYGEKRVETETAGAGITMVLCPECMNMVRVERTAYVLADDDHKRLVGYVVSCGHDFTPEASLDAAEEHDESGTD